MDDLPIELIHYILYDPIINLKWITVKKCLKTSKIFQVLNKRELSVLTNVSKNCLYCAETGDLQALQRCQIKNKIKVFIHSCCYNQLGSAQWLIKAHPDIDIHYDDELVFAKACERGHLKIAKWLIEYTNSVGSPIDIHANKEEAIRYSFKFKIIKCLIETFDGYDTTRFSEKLKKFYNKYKKIN